MPFPSFAGIDFPRDYPVVVVDDGDIIPLKGRDLEVVKIPDHAVGSLAFIDCKARILYSGDELGMPQGKPLNGSVEHWKQCMEKLMRHREKFDILCAGPDILPADIIGKYLENAEYILSGNEGAPTEAGAFPNFERILEDGRRVWKRKLPHPGDGPKDFGRDHEFKRVMDFAGCRIIYDIRKIRLDNG